MHLICYYKGMGESYTFQPLTKLDKITVVLYRAGIVMSSIITAVIAYMLLNADSFQNDPQINLIANILLLLLYIATGLSVFFIHLYVSSYHRALKKLYYIALAALALIFIIGKGSALEAFALKPYVSLLLLPLSVCLGFITAKEAFCFKLLEGYMLALIMPLYLLLLSAGVMTIKSISCGLVLIAAMLLFFTFRKVFMPLHYDIGDKSAYC